MVILTYNWNDLQNVKIILGDFKGEFVCQQILTNQYLSEDTNRLTEIYQSPDNILTSVDDKGLLVKNTLKWQKKIANLANGAYAVNFSTVNNFKQEINKDQILYNLKLSEDISKYTNTYQQPDNILTRVKWQRTISSKYLKRNRRRYQCRK